jgi:hypothetical protein
MKVEVDVHYTHNNFEKKKLTHEKHEPRYSEVPKQGKTKKILRCNY